MSMKKTENQKTESYPIVFNMERNLKGIEPEINRKRDKIRK